MVQCEGAVRSTLQCEGIELMEIPAYGVCDECSCKPGYSSDEDMESVQEMKEEKNAEKEAEIKVQEEEKEVEKAVETKPQIDKEKKFEPGERIRYRSQLPTPEKPPGKKVETGSKVLERIKNFEPGERIRYQPNLSTPGKNKGEGKNGAMPSPIMPMMPVTPMKAPEPGKRLLYRPAGRA